MITAAHIAAGPRNKSVLSCAEMDTFAVQTHIPMESVCLEAFDYL